MPSTKSPQPSFFCIGLLFALWLPVAVLAQNPERPPATQVIEPEIDRRPIRIPRIDTEDYEIGLFAGLLSVEDFGAKPVYGGRLVYHVNENYFVEAMLAKSTVSDESFFNLGLQIFPSREESLVYYAMSVGINLFPGEIFPSRKRAMASTMYLVAGVGNTNFVDENRFTLNVGLGVRVLPVDWLALHITMRDHLFKSDLLGTEKITNNFELTFGASVYF
jgi:outer membrane beta-barrel protein